MTLTPKLIGQTGDWFLQTRLPEFAVGWKDPQGKIHHLEIVGRRLSCREHNNPLVSGIIHLPQPAGHYRLPCLELQAHWPALFTSGREFRYFDSYDFRVGNLDVRQDKNINQACKHILATMINHLATTAIALRDQQRRRTYRTSPTNSRSIVALGPDLLNAAHELLTREQLGTTALVPKVDLENFFAALATPLESNDPNHTKITKVPPVATIESFVAAWKIPSNWVERAVTIASEVEAASPLAI